MSSLVVAIPVSPFLAGRYAGLSGIARSVIAADLAGASRIVLIGDRPEREDWRRSFDVRGRALPRIAVLAAADAIALQQGERLVTLPADRLFTPDGIRRLASGAGSTELAEGTDYYPAAPARALGWRILQGSVKTDDGWVCKRINRPISLRIAAFLLRFDIAPEPVTWATFVLSLIMTAMLAIGGAPGLAVGGLLYQVVSMADCIDGDIARSTWQTSRRGASLDTALDMVGNLGFVGGLGIGLVRVHGPAELAVAGLLVLVATTCVLLMTVLVWIGPRHGSFDVLRAALEVKLAPTPRLKALVLTAERLFKRDVYALVFALICLAGFAKTLPELALGGMVIWLCAILWCAPLIARDHAGNLLPAHSRAYRKPRTDGGPASS